MKKTSLLFGEFTQYDRKFITAENGLEPEKVTSVAFEGDTLYIAQDDALIEYADGKIKKTSLKVSKLFPVNGKLYAASGNNLVEIKKGKVKKVAELDAPVVSISVALDDSFWLITENTLYLLKDGEFEEVVDLPEDTVCLAAHDNKAKYAETVYVGSTVEGLMSLKGKRRHWAELLPNVTGVSSKKINCLAGFFVFCWRDSPSCWYCGQSDCPYETAWGITDINGNPKPAFYAIKDTMAAFEE